MIETTNLHQQSSLRPHTVASGASPSKAVQPQNKCDAARGQLASKKKNTAIEAKYACANTYRAVKLTRKHINDI
mgnify:CR=1 FL=1